MRIIYENWDLEKPIIPPRSRLYSIKPMGIGTSYIESLSSYIARLSSYHCLNVSHLIKQEVMPLIREQTQFTNINFKAQNHFPIWSINGLTNTSKILGQTLEQLTKRNDLLFLALSSLSEVISQRKSLKKYQAWCPLCYEQWHQEKQEIYTPLIWLIEPIKICPHHHQLLLNKCPYCLKSFRQIQLKFRNGYCPKCFHWLGYFYPKHHHNLSQAELQWQLTLINQIGNLISKIPTFTSSISSQRVATMINHYSNHISQNNLSLFLQKINSNINNKTLHKWINNSQNPTLEKLVQLCHDLDTSLLDFLQEDLENINWHEKINTINQQSFTSSYKAPQRLTKIELQKIKKLLELALEIETPPSVKEIADIVNTYPANISFHFPILTRNLINKRKDFNNKKKQEIRIILENSLLENPPPSMTEMTSRLGYKSQRSLSYLFPILCQKIASRFRNYRSTNTLEKKETLRQEIHNIAFALHHQGEKPTLEKVAIFLSKPRLIETDLAFETLNQICQELGYE